MILQPQPKGPTMTQEHVAGFASELVKMAQAMERVPQLEQEIRTLRNENDHNLTYVETLRVSLEASRTYAAGLEQRVRDAEVARNDAELRFLEADDAKDTLVRVLDGLGKDILGALQAVAPIPTLTSQSQSEVPLPVATADSSQTAASTTETTAVPKTLTEVPSAVMEAISVDAPLAGQSVPPLNGEHAPSQEWSVAANPDTAKNTDMAGQSEADPTSHHPQPISNTTEGSTPEHGGTETKAFGNSVPSNEGVSVPSNPTPSASIPSDHSPDTATPSVLTQDVAEEVNPHPFASTPTHTSPSVPSSAADIGDTEHIDYYGWHPASDK